ncbi:MAG: hypothetical protein Q7R52_04095, partial [archaeon]|nr:hypothetical protein [archaeon]
VDDFVILSKSKDQLMVWKEEISKFLEERLKLELHSDKSRIVNLSNGVDFIGFRNFYYFKLLRKRNLKNMIRKIRSYNKGELNYEKFFEVFRGWGAYADLGDSERAIHKLMRKIRLK